jgi:hypothetical protein
MDRERAAFLMSGVSIVASSRGANNAPAVARAGGCRVTPDGRVAVFVAASQAAALLDAVRATGAIAVVFSEPSTHYSLQLKGADAVIEPLLPGDGALIERYAAAFAASLCPLGYSEQLVRAVVWASPEDFVALAFTPSRAFDQTPGPRAGAALER